MVMTLCPLVSSPLLLIDHFKMMLTETNILEWGRGRRERREGGGGKGGREEEEGGGRRMEEEGKEGGRRRKEEEGGEGERRRKEEGRREQEREGKGGGRKEWGKRKQTKKKFRYRFGRKDFFCCERHY